MKKQKKLTKAKLKRIEKRRLNKELKLWANNVKARDNNCCIICGDKKMLNAHHILPIQDKNFMFDISNGVAVCPKHHQFSRKISAHSNSFAFFLWLQENRKEQFEYLKSKQEIII